jgi:predicted GNAT superfamily acetyltransferase
MPTHLSQTHFENGITIRAASSIADYRACQEAQKKAWGISEDGYLIPIATLVGAQRHGGLVLGAFQPDGSAVAVSFAFLGRLDDRICLYSQLTGVIPGYQSLGLGYQIKLAQRRFAEAEKIGVIAWAFDPLQAGNARFNLDKLGASASRYIENMYGERSDRLNAGVPTDRLIAEWPVVPLGAGLQPPTPPDPAKVELPDLIRTVTRPDGELEPVEVAQEDASPWARLPIPAEISRLRRDHPELAEKWRIAVREAFTSAFASGSRAVGFSRSDAAVDHYLLWRQPS